MKLKIKMKLTNSFPRSRIFGREGGTPEQREGGTEGFDETEQLLTLTLPNQNFRWDT
jgi:hypothetical protein